MYRSTVELGDKEFFGHPANCSLTSRDLPGTSRDGTVLLESLVRTSPRVLIGSMALYNEYKQQKIMPPQLCLLFLAVFVLTPASTIACLQVVRTGDKLGTDIV